MARMKIADDMTESGYRALIDEANVYAADRANKGKPVTHLVGVGQNGILYSVRNRRVSLPVIKTIPGVAWPSRTEVVRPKSAYQ